MKRVIGPLSIPSEAMTESAARIRFSYRTVIITILPDPDSLKFARPAFPAITSIVNRQS
jgi:hypothetical protein